MWYLLIFLLCVQKCTSKFKYAETNEVSYQVVGLFERDAIVQQLAFSESLHHVNLKGVRIQPVILKPWRTDSYSVWRELCSNKTLQPVAIFGPQNPITDGTIRDQCALSNIPHIQATWQPMDPDLELNEELEEEAEETEGEGEEQNAEQQEEEASSYKHITINFYPNADEIALAYGKLLKYYKWENFAALYEDNFGLLRVQKILAEVSDKSRITVYKLDPDGDNRNNRKIFKQLVKYQDSRILLDCHADRIMKYMREAEELSLINYYQHYIIVAMDTSRVADKLAKLPSNTTWLSLTEYDSIKNENHILAPRVGKWNIPTHSSPVTDFEVEALIMDDVANHLVRALRDIEELEQPSEFDCSVEDQPWGFGATLQEKLLTTKSVGVTGHIEFNERGQRINYVLYVNEIHLMKRSTVGRWESANGGAIIDTRPLVDDDRNTQSSKHFIVISRLAEPYFIEKKPIDGEEVDPDNKWEGFSVDLVKAIFDILKQENYNYTYEFVDAKNKTYGKFDTKTKKWNGLIGDLLDKKADLAVCDLTITEERKKVVDFSVPFMTLGISILFTKERKVMPGTYSFLNPYSFDVWMHTATAYCVVSIVLFICARISPADWENPEPCEKDPEVLENIWTFKNCAWLTMGSIMTQGCDILPKAIGTRWVCGMWWFFAVIVCQTYIAQLSASMTSALETEPINDIDGLAKQTKILYGAISGGSTLEFFRSSKDKTYQLIYETMMANPSVLMTSNEEGEKRVLKSRNKFAFFMESCTIEYKLKRQCDLKKVGGELDSKDYGIAMPANSPFRTHINRAILKLKENTKLDDIKNTWWYKKNGAKECDEPTDENDLEGDLEMDNLRGAFLVLIMGLVVAVFIAAIEFMNEVRNIVVREQVTHKEVFIKELKASLNFFKLQKPVLRNPSRAPSIVSSDSEDERRQQKRTMNAIDNFLDMEKEVH
ncbi:glutamate receptor ionotropic, kainate 2-like [Anticarsia gemmatalis]|uniref:glutamate receptor ionotropic, kainate 2-like n=1 Tax=Anticarsia gemmatalis TaxID=129554 RepID=UPI003F76C798